MRRLCSCLRPKRSLRSCGARVIGRLSRHADHHGRSERVACLTVEPLGWPSCAGWRAWHCAPWRRWRRPHLRLLRPGARTHCPKPDGASGGRRGLSGTKEVWRGDVAQTFAAGIPFVIPAGMDFDLVNNPNPTSGRYESICITVDDAFRHALRSNLRHVPVTGANRLDVDLTPALVEAFGHAASALTGLGVEVAATLARYRVLEILLLLAETCVAGMLAAVGRREQVEAIIYADPGYAWQVGEVAAELGIGASTLRRQLDSAGTSFREVLLSVRMITAGALLGSSGYSVMQAAQAAGYASRSHFSRRVQAVHGKTPRQLKAAV
jgi:AraC-like DNA-binding protein